MDIFWIFPVYLSKQILKLNVGLGFLSMKSYKNNKTNLIKFFDRFIVKHRVASKLLANVVTRTKKKVYPLATTKWNNKTCDKNIFKVGDAANLTDPLTAEGIANAIYSGFYLAKAINMSEDVENVKVNYQQLYQKYFQNELRIRLWQRTIVSCPIVSDCLLKMISPSRASQALLG